MLQICERLRSEGYEPLEYEHGVNVGEHPTKMNDAAVRHCDFFLACFSGNYNRRRDEIRRELRLARERREKLLADDIFILLASLDDAEVPEDLAEGFKYATLFSSNTWQEDGWKRLLETIKVGLEKRSS